MNTRKFCDLGNFDTPKSFPIFLIEEKNIYFRDFFYDLEIGESFKNTTRRGATIRLQKLPFKNYRFFSMNIRIRQDPESGLVNDLSCARGGRIAGLIYLGFLQVCFIFATNPQCAVLFVSENTDIHHCD